MKRNIFRCIFLAGILQLFFACTPEEPAYTDNDVVDVNTVTAIKLRPDHTLVLADGKATLNLNPTLYSGDAEIVKHRVEDSWMEFYTLAGDRVAGNFTTDDKGLCGEEVKVYARLKGKDVCSDTVTFRVIEPLDTGLPEIEIPVVFHIVQTTEDVVSYGGKFTQDRIELILAKLNHAFSGEVSVNPVGVHTGIRFSPALFDPSGRRLAEPGIDRVEVTEIQTGNAYADFLKQEKLIWAPEHYMNVWLISDGRGAVTDFGYNISRKCKPRYMVAGNEGMPQGLSLVGLPESHDWQPDEVGLIYKLQLFNQSSFTQGKTRDNAFVYYVGNYLGLLPTWGYLLYGNLVAAQDYCTDTQKYTLDLDNSSKNTGWEKVADEKYQFTAENIMDDQIGLHRSVSGDQCMRMRWVLQNCPERMFWKSRFALEGK